MLAGEAIKEVRTQLRLHQLQFALRHNVTRHFIKNCETRPGSLAAQRFASQLNLNYENVETKLGRPTGPAIPKLVKIEIPQGALLVNESAMSFRAAAQCISDWSYREQVSVYRKGNRVSVNVQAPDSTNKHFVSVYRACSMLMVLDDLR